MEKEVARKYAAELDKLKGNSKPIINHLTMMAEDAIKNGDIIVQTIERHLKIVSAG